MNAQTGAQKQKAIDGRRKRNLGLAANGAPLGLQVLKAGKDEGHMEAVRQYVAKFGVSREIGESYDKAAAELQQRQKLAQSEIIRSSIGCIHFENAEDMQFVEGEGVVVPLNKMMTAYRGRLASGPNAEYQMSTGIGLFHINTETNSLDLFLAFSAVVEVMDTASGLQGEFAVSPIDGANVRGPREGRKKSDGLSFIAGMGNDIAAGIPPDFTFMHSPRQEVGCPNDVLKKLVTQTDKIQSVIAGDKSMIMKAMRSPTSFIKDSYSALQDEIACSVEYLRPVNPNAASRFGVFECFGLMHILMEMPGNVMALAFWSSEMWNTISLS